MLVSTSNNAAWIAYRKEERVFIRTHLIFLSFVVICCAVSRAPSMLGKFSFEGIGLILNVGHVVVLAPFVIVSGLVWQGWAVRHLAEQRRLAAEQRGDEELPSLSYSSPAWLWLLLFLVPALGQLFLLIQFVQEMAPADVGCASFAHHRFLWDLRLADLDGMKSIYCFGLTPKEQNSMPYIYPPIQSWLYLVLLGCGIWQAWAIWRAWR